MSNKQPVNKTDQLRRLPFVAPRTPLPLNENMASRYVGGISPISLDETYDAQQREPHEAMELAIQNASTAAIVAGISAIVSGGTVTAAAGMTAFAFFAAATYFGANSLNQI